MGRGVRVLWGKCKAASDGVWKPQGKAPSSSLGQWGATEDSDSRSLQATYQQRMGARFWRQRDQPGIWRWGGVVQGEDHKRQGVRSLSGMVKERVKASDHGGRPYTFLDQTCCPRVTETNFHPNSALTQRDAKADVTKR